MEKEMVEKFVEESDQKIMDYIEGKEDDDETLMMDDEEEEDLDLPDDKLYLYDLLSLDPLFAMKLQEMADQLSPEKIVEIILNVSIRAAAAVNNRNPIEGYYWATLTADLIMAICVRQEIDPIPISEFVNTEQFEYLLQKFDPSPTEEGDTVPDPII